MATKLTQIIEGHFNNLLDAAGQLDEQLKKLSEERMAICRACKKADNTNCLSSNESCCRCGCYMPAKTKVKEMTCPAGKW